MRPTVAVYLLITGIVLFSVMTYILYQLAYLNNTAWTGMNNTAFENGFLMVGLPFAVLGFAVMLIIKLFKGPDQRGGGPPQ